ncbi:MAG: hypothetical protein LJE65_06775 [Desulfobacteraceae bacterium]|nr:hypothetical protein [Desulfobacteraceae bacterium]
MQGHYRLYMVTLLPDTYPPSGALKRLLRSRLEQLGVEPHLVPGFLRSLSVAIFTDRYHTLSRVNRTLHYLGWTGYDLDYHTLQLAIACFEADGLRSLESKPAQWFERRFRAA